MNNGGEILFSVPVSVKGSWEAYASATALAREGRMAAAKYPNCEIYNLVDGNIKLINAKNGI